MPHWMLFQKLVSSLLYCHPKLAAVFADFSEESLKCGPIRGGKKNMSEAVV